MLGVDRDREAAGCVIFEEVGCNFVRDDDFGAGDCEVLPDVFGDVVDGDRVAAAVFEGQNCFGGFAIEREAVAGDFEALSHGVAVGYDLFARADEFICAVGLSGQRAGRSIAGFNTRNAAGQSG